MSESPASNAAAEGTVTELLLRAAKESPDLAALETIEEAITYGELLSSASDMAARLRKAGAVEGSVVATLLPNGIAWLVSYWGAALNGNIVAPLSTRAPAAEVDGLVRTAGAAVLIDSEGLHRLEPTGAGTPAAEIPVTKSSVAAERVHLIQFTSGSTGDPKGAMLTHGGLAGAARQHVADWKLSPGDAVFVPNPFSHILGLVYGVLTPVAARATVLTLPKFDLEAAVELLIRGEAVAMTGAPAHLQMLTEWVERHGTELPHLRLGFTGGAPIAPAWVARVRKALHLEALINGYGMSEVGSIAQTAIDDPPEQVATSVGLLAPGLEARIVDPETGSDLPGGEVGELWIRGASVMIGYLGKPTPSEEALVDGAWLRTGDLMRRDGQGRLTFVNRLGDMFTVGGFNVYPAQVESALMRHPAIEDVAVVPVPDERLGSVPVAFVVASSGAGSSSRLTEAAIREHCKAHLRNYMVPRRVFYVEALPLNRAGKVDRGRLAQQAQQSDVE